MARSAQAALRSSGTWVAAQSSSENWPASARRASNVATIGFVKEPIGNLVSDVTGSARARVREPVIRRRRRAITENADGRARHGMLKSVLAEQAG